MFSPTAARSSAPAAVSRQAFGSERERVEQEVLYQAEAGQAREEGRRVANLVDPGELRDLLVAELGLGSDHAQDLDDTMVQTAPAALHQIEREPAALGRRCLLPDRALKHLARGGEMPHV